MMETNHVIIPDNKGRIYCQKIQAVTLMKESFFRDECMNCKYFNGFGAGIGAVECKYEDGSDAVSVFVENPESLVISYGKVVFQPVQKNGENKI